MEAIRITADPLGEAFVVQITSMTPNPGHIKMGEAYQPSPIHHLRVELKGNLFSTFEASKKSRSSQ